jgi:hypothetical protein
MAKRIAEPITFAEDDYSTYLMKYYLRLSSGKIKGPSETELTAFIESLKVTNGTEEELETKRLIA